MKRNTFSNNKFKVIKFILHIDIILGSVNISLITSCSPIDRVRQITMYTILISEVMVGLHTEKLQYWKWSVSDLGMFLGTTINSYEAFCSFHLNYSR